MLWVDRLIPPHDAERFHNEVAGSTFVMFESLANAPEEKDPTCSVRREAISRDRVTRSFATK